MQTKPECKVSCALFNNSSEAKLRCFNQCKTWACGNHLLSRHVSYFATFHLSQMYFLFIIIYVKIYIKAKFVVNVLTYVMILLCLLLLLLGYPEWCHNHGFNFNCFRLNLIVLGYF